MLGIIIGIDGAIKGAQINIDRAIGWKTTATNNDLCIRPACGWR